MIAKLQLNTLHRVLMYLTASVWFMVYVLNGQINYQDAWILDGIMLPFAALILVFLYVFSAEEDNRVIAFLSAWTILVVTLVPALKYQQPYGSSIDSTEHFLMVQSLMGTGEVIHHHTYSAIPAMHSWLASLGLTTGISDIWTIKLGLPLTGALMPLIMYWWARRNGVPNDISRYAIGATCLSTFPYFLPNGTGFSLVPLMFLLGVILVREGLVLPQLERVVYTILALVGLFQIMFWHSTTPMLLPAIFVAVAVTPILAWIFRRSGPVFSSILDLLRMSLMATVMFFGYRILVNDPVFRAITEMFFELFDPANPVSAEVPKKLFEVSMIDAAVTTYLIHGRALVLYGLTGLGTLVAWRYRSYLRESLFLYLYLLLVFLLFAGLTVVSFGIGVSYTRFLAISVAFSPFFVGAFLWWMNHVLLTKILRLGIVSKIISASAIIIIIMLVIVDFFSMQPLVPNSKSTVKPDARDYLVWLHAVNNAYQERMLTFAETYTEPESRFAIDITGLKQFMRYFGATAASRRGLYVPLFRREEVDPTKVEFFLLHWPGPAGGLGEKIEFRSTNLLHELRQRPEWGLIYDNGESFILWVR